MVEDIGPYWFRFTYLVTFDPQYNIQKFLKSKPDKFSLKAEVWKLKGIQDQFMSLRDESISSALKEFRNQVKRREELGNRLKKINYDFSVSPHQLSIVRAPREYITIRALFLYRQDQIRNSQDQYSTSRSSVPANQIPRQSRIQRSGSENGKIWILYRKSKSGQNRCPIIPCWPAMAKKCCTSEIYVFLTQYHDTDTIHRFTFSTLGITRIENSKMEGNQGLQL